MRKHNFVINEYYHLYNRGSDKRDIILDKYDLQRFLKSIMEFNTTEPIGSIYQKSFAINKISAPNTRSEKLISIITYCINQNHFHLLVTPLVEKGVEKFMQRIGGYTRYFNEKYKRNGVLFQGKFKSKHIDKNEYLLHLSAYINMNNRGPFGNQTTELSKSSLEEYIGDKNVICDKEIILEQFKNPEEYLKFMLESWQNSQKHKKDNLEFT